MLRMPTQGSVQFKTRIANECTVMILFRPDRGCPIASQVAIKYYGRFSVAEISFDATRATHVKGREGWNVLEWCRNDNQSCTVFGHITSVTDASRNCVDADFRRRPGGVDLRAASVCLLKED